MKALVQNIFKSKGIGGLCAAGFTVTVDNNVWDEGGSYICNLNEIK